MCMQAPVADARGPPDRSRVQGLAAQHEIRKAEELAFLVESLQGSLANFTMTYMGDLENNADAPSKRMGL